MLHIHCTGITIAANGQRQSSLVSMACLTGTTGPFGLISGRFKVDLFVMLHKKHKPKIFFLKVHSCHKSMYLFSLLCSTHHTIMLETGLDCYSFKRVVPPIITGWVCSCWDPHQSQEQGSQISCLNGAQVANAHCHSIHCLWDGQRWPSTTWPALDRGRNPLSRDWRGAQWLEPNRSYIYHVWFG